MSLPKAFTVALKQNSLGALRQEVFENCRKSSVTISRFLPQIYFGYQPQWRWFGKGSYLWNMATSRVSRLSCWYFLRLIQYCPLIYHENQPNVGKRTTHASYKVGKFVGKLKVFITVLTQLPLNQPHAHPPQMALSHSWTDFCRCEMTPAGWATSGWKKSGSPQLIWKIPFRKLTYTTLQKGKPSSNMPLGRIC